MLKSNIVCCVLFLLTKLLLIKTCACEGTVEVKIQNGFVSGKVEKTYLSQKVYNVFKGIPYAQPPINELRFQPPKPQPSWTHVYEAYQNKPTCVQYSTRKRNGEKFGISGSEDCLYLSVFTPSLKGSQAVMVFDYHDNYRTGFNGTRTYSPEFLAEEDIVVVTVSHRLGILGYLTTEDNVIPANNGIRDYILALKWIKENIKYFGGDPNRVTLMGCKGGGSLANNLLYSKAAEGLFHAVTIQGGTAHEPGYFPKVPRNNAFKLAELLKIEAEDSTSLLKELQNIDFVTIVANETGVISDEEFIKYHLSIYPFSPVVEKESPEAIITTLPENGKIVNDVPVLIGFNSREGLDLNSMMVIEPRIIKELDPNFFVLFPIRTNYRFDRNNSAFEEYKEEILNFYLKDGHLHYANILEYSVYVGDVMQNYALNLAVKKLSKELDSPTYYYMFDFYGHLNENMIYLSRNVRSGIKNWGASAGDEICYLNLCSRIRRNYDELKKLVTEHTELKVLRKMLRLWSNFAKTGNPTPEENDKILKNFKWKPTDKTSDNLAFAHITKNLKMDLNPLGEREKFWDRTLEKYSKMLINGVVHKIDIPHIEL